MYVKARIFFTSTGRTKHFVRILLMFLVEAKKSEVVER
jgi:hypothetical protein